MTDARDSRAPAAVLVTRPDVPGRDAVDGLAGDGWSLVWEPGRPADGHALGGRVDAVGAVGVIALGDDPLDARFFAAAGAAGVRVVSLVAVGHDNVDLAAAERAGVVVTNTPGVLAETVADTAFALVLMARRRLVEASDDMRAGRWAGFALDGWLGLDVHGATLGLLGYGEIGRAVARRGRGFGMRVQHLARPSAPDDEVSSAVGWEELLGGSDVVVVALPLRDGPGGTRGIVDAAALRLMRRTATLVNVGRGPLVVEADLLAALGEGRLHSAGLDVFDGEPRRDPRDPVMRTPGLVVLPHVGSASEATRVGMTRLAVRNVRAVLAGQPPLTPVTAPTT
ncbi:NAD(P)-dependent oxidoreductase [Aquipuribacter nitratireducens]|uniref:NAD(P)-dependent oxidoreductase n=1 Tax=Aquipuribacter nitratireducens TaxID=650104 RepID=A0ABW0GLG6_9MICO